MRPTLHCPPLRRRRRRRRRPRLTSPQTSSLFCHCILQGPIVTEERRVRLKWRERLLWHLSLVTDFLYTFTSLESILRERDKELQKTDSPSKDVLSVRV